MLKKIECVAICTDNIQKSIEFYTSIGLTKVWESYQDAEQKWSLVGLRFPEGEAELVLKNNPDLQFAETELVVEDVRAFYESLRHNPDVTWIRTPFPNALGGHVAVMQAPDQNVFVLVGR